jgi:hypothetical protein
MIGGKREAVAVVVEVQNRSLTNALRSISHFGIFKKHLEHIKHFCDGYDCILAYRNYYVHSFAGMEGADGVLDSMSAKSKIARVKEKLTVSQLNEMIFHCQSLYKYGTALTVELGYRNITSGETKGISETFPEKPVWPQILRKPASYFPTA